MLPEQQAAFVMAMAACVNAEAAGMQAANLTAIRLGKEPMYSESAFKALIDNYGIHQNAVLSLFQR